jgi:hypothetical protein
VDTGETGSLDQQVCEIDAGGVATYLVLSDLIKGGSRPLVVRALNLGMEPASVQDEVLFLCFVVAAASFFFVRKLNNNTDFFRLTHPPSVSEDDVTSCTPPLHGASNFGPASRQRWQKTDFARSWIQLRQPPRGLIA